MVFVGGSSQEINKAINIFQKVNTEVSFGKKNFLLEGRYKSYF